MHIQFRDGLGLAICASLSATPAWPQCRPADATGMALVRDVSKYAQATDPLQVQVRDSLRLSPPSKSGVVLVTKSQTCKAANTAYQKAVTGDRTTLSGLVYVVQTGSTYVVLDPAYRYTMDSNPTRMVFDSQWVLLSIF
jgi:hypothetical protein